MGFLAEPVDSPDNSFIYQAVVAGAPGDQVVKITRGLIGAISVQGAITVIPKDGATQCWGPITSAADAKFNGNAIQCKTSIVLNFSAAGTAYILYK